MLRIPVLPVGHVTVSTPVLFWHVLVAPTRVRLIAAPPTFYVDSQFNVPPQAAGPQLSSSSCLLVPDSPRQRVVQLPASHLLLFHCSTRSLERDTFPGSRTPWCRLGSDRLDFTNAASNEFEQLAQQRRRSAIWSRRRKRVIRESRDLPERRIPALFSTPLVHDYTDLVKVILEGTDSVRKLKVEPYKLNVCGM